MGIPFDCMKHQTRFQKWIIALGVLAAGLAPLRAQWITQTLDLKAGWNAVYLHVDASHATLDDLVGPSAPELTPIEQVWRWTPVLTEGQFFSSPQEPLDTGTQWTSWKRGNPSATRLEYLTANTAYLVYSTADYTWNLKGQPVAPVYRWSTSGLNFIGFPTVETNPPELVNLLAPMPGLLAGDFFRYPGGELGPENPKRLLDLRTPVRRGEAFWIRAGEIYNDYYGPFEILAAGDGRADFGETLSVFTFRVRNVMPEQMTFQLQLTASEAPPAGQAAIAGLPPLLLRGERDLSTLTYAFSELAANTPVSWTLAAKGQPGSEVEIVLGLDRAAMPATKGALLAGVLQLSDSLGHTRVDLAASAQVASQAGLWVGQAAVTHVAQYLKSYAEEAGSLLVDTNGGYVVTNINTDLTPVPVAYPLRLVVHNPEGGSATLLQRVYHGFNAATNPVVATGEAALAPHLIHQARRISVAHLPWTEANDGWDFDGPLGLGTTPVQITAVVANDYRDQASNPFLHTYHPDHDNLDPTFDHELPQGSESYTIVREISLTVQPPANDFASRVSAGLTLTGDYAETIRLVGLARAGNTHDTREFTVRGSFKLTRISEIPTLTRVP